MGIHLNDFGKGTPEGTRYTKEHPAETPDGNSPLDCCIFTFESLSLEYKNGVSRGVSRKDFQVHPHPYGVRLNLAGLSHGLMYQKCGYPDGYARRDSLH